MMELGRKKQALENISRDNAVGALARGDERDGGTRGLQRFHNKAASNHVRAGGIQM
eukprot:CAMPEP_0174894354 /NCGR_PEP_ID=MMETSP0167-20121228/9009_1 /TAXON_ID=38298 /ORGANISM="Rhodella maculata, Strain CCMP736" /LENGTH=55 /DNA_ID=CAMNT_0016133417 /DNA_START=217 /DNA_END=385 /DNA_ORIENTATION=+